MFIQRVAGALVPTLKLKDDSFVGGIFNHKFLSVFGAPNRRTELHRAEKQNAHKPRAKILRGRNGNGVLYIIWYFSLVKRVFWPTF